MSFRPSRGNRTVPSRPDNQPIDDHDDNSSESDLDIKHASSRSKRFTVRKTAEQVKNLQRAYTNNPKPTKEARKVLAEEIGLTERIVTTWFRDQRSSDKKKHVEGGIGPIRHIGDRRARSTRIQSPSVLSDPESEPDVEPRSTAFVTAATPYAPPSIHIHETSSYPTSSSRINVVHPYSPHSKLGHLARLSDDMTVATQPLAPTPASDRWARASPSTWPPSSPKTGESPIRPSEMRIVPTATFPHQSTEWDHASHSGDESDDDDDGLNNHPYTPHTTYRNLSRPQIYTPSPVRSEITLPSLTSEFKRTFPAVPSPGNVQPPENGGWTSEWRWGQYGNISNIRSTLSCAEWTPEPLSDDAASEKSAASPIGSLSLQLPPLRIQGQPPAVFRRTSSPMKLPVILNPEPAPRVHFESRL